MQITRRAFLTIAGASCCAAHLARPGTASAAGGVEPDVADNGLYTQPWLLESFMELGDDHAAAAEEGKLLAILFEQRGCPYCRELHRVNFAKQEIRDYIDKNFQFLQLDMWGSREVTDFDGKALPEKDLAQRWGVLFTPTVVFFPADTAALAGKSGKEGEVARMPGYFKPFHFLSMLQYVREGRYADQHFQRFLQDKFKALEEQGKKPEVW